MKFHSGFKTVRTARNFYYLTLLRTCTHNVYKYTTMEFFGVPFTQLLTLSILTFTILFALTKFVQRFLEGRERVCACGVYVVCMCVYGYLCARKCGDVCVCVLVCVCVGVWECNCVEKSQSASKNSVRRV